MIDLALISLVKLQLSVYNQKQTKYKQMFAKRTCLLEPPYIHFVPFKNEIYSHMFEDL